MLVARLARWGASAAGAFMTRSRPLVSRRVRTAAKWGLGLLCVAAVVLSNILSPAEQAQSSRASDGVDSNVCSSSSGSTVDLLILWTPTSAERRPRLSVLKYSLRSVEKFAGHFVRNIVLVTPRGLPDVPEWLDKRLIGTFSRPGVPRLHVVSNTEMFLQPHEQNHATRNSKALEALFHRIDDKLLGRCFLYLNDDTVLNRYASTVCP